MKRTYIIAHYNPLVRIIDLVSHTTYVVCVNFIYKFKVDSKRQSIGWPGSASALTSSRPSLNRLYHNWTCVLVTAHPCTFQISFFTQNLIQFLWFIFPNSKISQSSTKHDKIFYLSKTNWQSKMASIVNIFYIHNRNKNATTVDR